MDNSDLLNHLAAGVFDRPIDADQLRAFLEDPRHVMFVAIDDGAVVGVASAVEYFHPDKKPELWINEVGVTPTHQRQGIGRQLVAALLKAARDRGCATAWVLTEPGNEAAPACYGAVSDQARSRTSLLVEWGFDE
ncbi:MAG: GNAT family N-acetyltransferase [Pseudomonadota bacterium]